MNHVQSFVDKRNDYFKRSFTQQDDLISILRSFAETIKTETGEDNEVVSVTNYPTVY